jgi:lipopolysaccharide cholinephosphotransferase
MKKEIHLEELKQIELRILKQIHDVCAQQGFRYFLVGGTLLGAVRHNGFIPWDDDIDIGMPRVDYERFIDYCSTNEVPFKVICNKLDPKYGYLFAKAMDPNTVLIEETGNRYDVELGVYVDIFPIDGLGDTQDEATANLNKTRFNRELLVAANWKKFSRSKTRAVYYEPIRLAFFVMSRMSSFGKLIRKIESRYDTDAFDKRNYVGCVCGAYRNKEIVEREVFLEYIDVPFEDTTFKCPKQYDKYLSSIYGNYMQLPPEEKRVTHHSFDAYYKTES